MTFALTASKPLEVEGFEAGAVATHTPRGDGNLYSSHRLSFILDRNPYPARGREQWKLMESTLVDSKIRHKKTPFL